MANKSNAQIRRAMKRAASRGEEYTPSTLPDQEEELPAADTSSNSDEQDQLAQDDSHQATTKDGKPAGFSDETMTAAAIKLLNKLAEIGQSEELRSKERRSLKRKAEAIAAEHAGCTVEEMEKFLEEKQESITAKAAENASQRKGNRQSDAEQQLKQQNPYIVFVGQLNYDTTKEGLLDHIKKELGPDFKVNQQTIKIRLLTDTKTKTSRGMAFVEVVNPEILYACLKLHHTMLDGRRLNVERSAGGKKNSDTRSQKLKRFREEQEQYLANVVDNILADYKKNGELQENELDEGAIALCKRHTASLVEATLKMYIENNGREMDNSSAYFTFLLCKLAEEGVYPDKDKQAEPKQMKGKGPRKTPDRGANRGGRAGEQSPSKNKKAKTSVSSNSWLKGVDFSSSETTTTTGGKDFSSIFPSLNRGRGRGRGYM